MPTPDTSAEKTALQLQLKEEQRKFREELKKKRKELADKEKAQSASNEKYASELVGAPFAVLDKALIHLENGIKAIDLKDGSSALLSIFKVLKEVIRIEPEIIQNPSSKVYTVKLTKGLIPETIDAISGVFKKGREWNLVSKAHNAAITKERGALGKLEESIPGKAIRERLKILEKSINDIANGEFEKAKFNLQSDNGQMSRLVKSESLQKSTELPPAVGNNTEKLHEAAKTSSKEI